MFIGPYGHTKSQETISFSSRGVWLSRGSWFSNMCHYHPVCRKKVYPVGWESNFPPSGILNIRADFSLHADFSFHFPLTLALPRSGK